MVACAGSFYCARCIRVFCMWQGFVCLGDPRLGGAQKDPELVATDKSIALSDQLRWNGVEGKFGQGERRLALDLVREMLLSASR